ncbi:MAG: glycosyltransferase family 4 protein [Pseudomonadota bacterium]
MNTRTKGNLLLVSNYPSDVGYAWWLMEHFWVLLAEHFENSGKRVYLAYPEINTLPAVIQNSRINVIAMTVPGDSPASRQSLRAFIRTNSITDVYFTDRPWFSPDYFVLRKSGVNNIVIHDHTPGDRPPVNGIKGFLKALRHRFPWVCADTQFNVSELMRQRSITNARIPAKRCITVQNGTPPVQNPSEQRAFSRQALGIPEDSFVCITTGRAHPYKRFDFIIGVAEHIARTNPDSSVVFLLIGDGPAMADLQQLVRDKDLVDTVRLLGFRSDTRKLLPAADAAMHAALGEGFSLSIVEYMSASLPVLVPDIPSVKQAIAHNETGYIYSKDSPEEAAEFVQKLRANPELRARLGTNARRKADAHYTLETCSEQFITACERAFG